MPKELLQPDLNEVSPEQARLEAERMQDVVMLVDTVLRNEESTVGVLVDCLYDIGSVRLITQKVEPVLLQDVAKPLARLSKPAFRMLALRWLKKNVPILLANWLYKKVKFSPQPQPAPPPQDVQQEIQQELDEQIAQPIAEAPMDPVAAMPPAIAPASQTPYPPDAAPPRDGVQPEAAPSDTPPSQALVVVPQNATAAAPLGSDTSGTDGGIVPLSEYNRAIAQIKYRDRELRQLRAQLRICMALVVGAAIAMGGLLLAVAPDMPAGQSTSTNPVQVDE